MIQEELIDIISRDMGIDLPPQPDLSALRHAVNEAVNYLIQHDFNRLVNILYRVDLDEQKLKFLLQENVGEDASLVITNLIIERQQEKIKTRNGFRKSDENITDEERW